MKALIKDRHIEPADREAFIGYLNKFEGKDVEVIIKEWQESKTLKQNRTVHKYIDILAKHIGYTPKEMKALIKKELGLFELVENKKTKEIIPIIDTFAAFKKKEMSEVIEYIVIIAAEYGCQILSPEEFYNES